MARSKVFTSPGKWCPKCNKVDISIDYAMCASCSNKARLTRPEIEPNPAYEWSWEKLNEHLAVFDKVEVSYWDGKGRPNIIDSGNSGISVLRVTDVSPVKSAAGEVILSIATDSQWFKNEQVHLMSEPALQSLIAQEADKLANKRLYRELDILAARPSDTLFMRLHKRLDELRRSK